jgi:hypothetical protein
MSLKLNGGAARGLAGEYLQSVGYKQPKVDLVILSAAKNLVLHAGITFFFST